MPSSQPDIRNDRFFYKPPRKGDEDGRSPAQHDRDRLLYSSSFRRLAEVTQVVAANSGYVFHNRLTHSLQVAQVARRLAEKLNRDHPKRFANFEGLDPDVAEAAALAHDIGHPPFGHVIEEQLNELACDFGGFEGNAQSFRILSRLAFHSHEYGGLNLTRATLCAVLKYPWLKDGNPKKPHKWGAYLSEKDEMLFARELYPYEFKQSTEAFLMDWADDITYCVHDLEDFYRAGRLPLHLLAAKGSDEIAYFFDNMFKRQQEIGNDRVLARRSELEEVFRELLFLTFAPTQPYRGTEQQRTGLRSFTGTLVGRYINGVSLRDDETSTLVHVDPQYKDEVFMLKELTWTYVIQEPALATQQLGQQHMVKSLFQAYGDAAMSQARWKLFPTYYQERLRSVESDHDKLRVCIDLIAGMTEVQVQRLYSRISGYSADSSLSDPLA